MQAITLIILAVGISLGAFIREWLRVRAFRQIVRQRHPLSDAEIMIIFERNDISKIVNALDGLGKLIGVDGRQLRGEDRLSSFAYHGLFNDPLTEVMSDFLLQQRISNKDVFLSVKNCVTTIVKHDLAQAWQKFVELQTDKGDIAPYHGLLLLRRRLPWPPGVAKRRFRAGTPGRSDRPWIIAERPAADNAQPQSFQDQ